MQTSLREFREKFLESTLDFLWNTWTGLGIPGTSTKKLRKVIDPEALLLFTLYFGRYDPRLFDGLIDWLVTNGKWINFRRLVALSLGWSEVFPQLLAVSEIVRNEGNPKEWRLMTTKLKPLKSRDEKFFLLSDDHPLPISGGLDADFKKFGLKRGRYEHRAISSVVSNDGWANLIFKLRALFGVNSRAEIFAYLLVYGHGYPSKISYETRYSQKNIQDIMAEIANSNLLERLRSGRTALYRLRHQDLWFKLLGLDKNKKPDIWVNWRSVFWELRLIWNAVRGLDNDYKDNYKLFSMIKERLSAVGGRVKYPGFPIYQVQGMIYEGDKSLIQLLEELSSFYREVYEVS